MDTSVILDSGHTAWMIVATLLVFMMTIPGIALFYGGLVRQKNMLSLVMQSLAIAGVVSILWVVFGYSLAFGTGYEGSGFFKYGIGGFDKVMLNGIGLDTLTATGIPEMLFVMFQCMFALITPALILGAFAERVRFAGFLCFTVLWSILVYMPMAHWVWGGGFLMEMGAVDFAGGTVVHVNAGVAALVMALMVGRRKDYRAGRPITPHNIPFVFLGTALLWLGWFGFNAGLGGQQEMHYGGGLYGSRGRFGGHHAGSRFGRFGRCAVHRFDNLGRLFLDGGCREAQVRLR